jgi:hypothetical protein
VANLHPELVSSAGAGRDPSPELFETAVAIACDVARPLEVPAVNLHIAGEQKTGASF